MTTETYTPTQLRVGDLPVKDRLACVQEGHTLPIGTVLRKELHAAEGLEEGEDNTGNGTAGTVTLGSKAGLGTYQLTCIDADTFLVFDPRGGRLQDLTVDEAYDNGHFAVTIAGGAVDFAAGDTFTLVVTASGKSVPYDDVEALFDGILAEAVDASSAATVGTAFVAGHFRRGALSFADGVTITEAIEHALALHGVYVTTAQS